MKKPQTAVCHCQRPPPPNKVTQMKLIVLFELFKMSTDKFPVFNLTVVDWRVRVQQAVSDRVYSSLLRNCKELLCA